MDKKDYYRLVWLLKGLLRQGQHWELFDFDKYPKLWNELAHLFWNQHLSSNRPKEIFTAFEAFLIVSGHHKMFCCICACPLVEHFVCYHKKASTAPRPRCHDCYLDTSKTVVKEQLLKEYGITITSMKEAGYYPLRDIRTLPFREYFIMTDIEEFKRRHPDYVNKNRNNNNNKKRKWNVSNFVLK